MCCAAGSGKCDMTFAAGFICVCQALACNRSLTVVFEMENLSLRMIFKRVWNKYSNCLCNNYIAFCRQQVHTVACGIEKWPQS